MTGKRNIRVALIEFVEGGNTIWVQGKAGFTVLRIKCTGKIKVKKQCTNAVAHADMIVSGDIEVCVPTSRDRNDCPVCAAKRGKQHDWDMHRDYELSLL